VDLTVVVSAQDLEFVNLISIFQPVLDVGLMQTAPISMMPPLVPLENVFKVNVYLLLLQKTPFAALKMEIVMFLKSVMEIPNNVLLMLFDQIPSSAVSPTQTSSVIRLISALAPPKTVKTLLNQLVLDAESPKIMVDVILKTNVMEQPRNALTSSPPLLPS